MKLAHKYLATVGGVAFFYGNFIACGSQMYQISLEKDVDDKRQDTQVQNGGAAGNKVLGVHASGGWATLPIQYYIGKDLNDAQTAELAKAMATWEMAVGQTLFKFKGEHNKRGNDFPNLYSSLDDTFNGNYMDDDWSKNAKPKEVLATTIWNNDAANSAEIVAADIRYNREYYVFGDSYVEKPTASKEVVDMQSLALHELGHLLGLGHMESTKDPYSIMNPSLYIGEGLASRRLSRGDIERIQSVYGCRKDSCDIDALVIAMEQNNALNITDDNNSVETTSVQ